jgi:hypothetical protein
VYEILRELCIELLIWHVWDFARTSHRAINMRCMRFCDHFASSYQYEMYEILQGLRIKLLVWDVWDFARTSHRAINMRCMRFCESDAMLRRKATQCCEEKRRNVAKTKATQCCKDKSDAMLQRRKRRNVAKKSDTMLRRKATQCFEEKRHNVAKTKATQCCEEKRRNVAKTKATKCKQSYCDVSSLKTSFCSSTKIHTFVNAKK